MLFVDNQNMTDPRLNLALEEFLLRQVTVQEPLLLFYINEPAVIIGRNQNTLEEIDPDYVQAHAIHVVRRLSGGGAVYHDLGNLNFSFVTPDQAGLHDFTRFTTPVIEALRSLEVEAELRGKSDIFAGGKKISGNAQYASRGRMFSHGTLLFDTDLAVMLQAINPRRVRIESKAVQSVRNFVTNIRELLAEPLDIHAFRATLLDSLFAGQPAPTYDLSAADWAAVRALAEERYGTWAWNFGRSPAFTVQKSERLPVGKLDVRLDVDKGRIRAMKIFGDFAGRRDVAELEAQLAGVRYDPQALAAALEGVDIRPYFGDLPTADFLRLLY